MTADEQTIVTLLEAIARLERKVDELAARPPADPNRAYTDAEVCERLGGISQTTLWEIRVGRGLLKSSYVYPGSRVRRTTERQLQDYLDYLSSAEAAGGGGDDDSQLDERLDDLSARRSRQRNVA